MNKNALSNVPTWMEVGPIVLRNIVYLMANARAYVYIYNYNIFVFVYVCNAILVTYAFFALPCPTETLSKNTEASNLIKPTPMDYI